MRAVVVFSGGPDSTAALLWAQREGYDIEALTFQFKGREQYGEMRAAIQVAEALELAHTILDFREPLTVFDGPIHVLMHADDPESSNQRASRLLPFGAGLVLGMTASYAIFNGLEHVVWGATKDDAFEHSDYSEAFAKEFAALVMNATGQQLAIHVPNAESWKPQVVATFSDRPDLFAMTWSCKLNATVQCGRCSACSARRASAHLAGVTDSTKYVGADYDNALAAWEPGSIGQMDWANYNPTPSPK